MATRGTFAVEHADGTISQIYSHWDNYLSWNGELLLKHYNSQARAEELISHGDISKLDIKISPKGQHSFDYPEEGVCVYYGRDRGEEGTAPARFENFDQYQREVDAQGYEYIYRNDRWYVCFSEAGFIELAQAIQEQADEA